MFPNAEDVIYVPDVSHREFGTFIYSFISRAFLFTFLTVKLFATAGHKSDGSYTQDRYAPFLTHFHTVVSILNRLVPIVYSS
jgi:hypothetical protein